jgi:cell division protein FtsQ
MFAVALLAAMLLQTPIFSVNTISLVGSTHYSPDDVQQSVDLDGRPLISLPVEQVESQIEQMPWIASASIQKIWPNEVKVSVTERVPVALTPADGGWYVVDASGRVLAQAVSRPTNLLAIVDAGDIEGPGSTLDPRFNDAMAVAALVPVELVAQIEGVIADQDGSVRLAMTSGVIVKMGEATNIPAKYQALATVLRQIDDVAKVAEIDVRAADTPVVVSR